MNPRAEVVGDLAHQFGKYRVASVVDATIPLRRPTPVILREGWRAIDVP